MTGVVEKKERMQERGKQKEERTESKGGSKRARGWECLSHASCMVITHGGLFDNLLSKVGEKENQSRRGAILFSQREDGEGGGSDNCTPTEEEKKQQERIRHTSH